MHHKKSFLSKNALSFSLIIALLIVVCAEAFMLHSKGSTESFKSYAEKIVADCAAAPYRPTCYEEMVPKLMDKISLEDAFKVTRFIQDEDTTYQYCHVLGHKLAERETAKDPSRWQEVVQRCPSGICSNGCIHGAFQERFRKETLTPPEIEQYKSQFANVCEDRPGFSPTGIEQSSCYHALGHLFMYVTSADIDKSLDLCKELTIKGIRDYSQLCSDGAFMQIFQPLEPDDFTLIKGKEVDKAHVKGFCDNFSGKEQGSCWSESWPLFRSDFADPKELVKHCNYLPSQEEKNRCFNAITYVLTAQMNLNQDRISAFCEGMPKANAANCFAQASSRLIETDYRNGPQAAALCTKAAPYDPNNLCFKELLKYSTFNFHEGSEAFTSFCNALPTPWKEMCLTGEGYKPTSYKAIAE